MAKLFGHGCKLIVVGFYRSTVSLMDAFFVCLKTEAVEVHKEWSGKVIVLVALQGASDFQDKSICEICSAFTLGSSL